MRAVIRLLFPPSLGELKATARAELLAKSLARRLGQEVQVEVARTYEELEKRVLADEVELAWAPPLLCARVEPTARGILKAIRHGRASYRAAFVGRAGESLDVSRLAGKTAAWVDPLSTAGYLLPRAHLKLLGQDPDKVLGGQRFLGSYRDALLAVLSGAADFASIYTPGADEAAVRGGLAQHVAGEEKRFASFGTTAEAPNDGLVVTARLSAAEAEKLLEALLPLTDGSKGPTLLLEVCDAQAFQRARPGDYRVLRSAR